MESCLKIKRIETSKHASVLKTMASSLTLEALESHCDVSQKQIICFIFSIDKWTHKDILYPREGKAILLLTIGFAKKAGRIFLKKQNCRSEISTFEGVLIFLSASKWTFPKRQSSMQEKSWDWDWLLFPRNLTNRRKSTKWWHRWEELLFPKPFSSRDPNTLTVFKKPLKTWLFPQTLV